MFKTNQESFQMLQKSFFEDLNGGNIGQGDSKALPKFKMNGLFQFGRGRQSLFHSNILFAQLKTKVFHTEQFRPSLVNLKILLQIEEGKFHSCQN